MLVPDKPNLTVLLFKLCTATEKVPFFVAGDCVSTQSPFLMFITLQLLINGATTRILLIQLQVSFFKHAIFLNPASALETLIFVI